MMTAAAAPHDFAADRRWLVSEYASHLTAAILSATDWEIAILLTVHGTEQVGEVLGHLVEAADRRNGVRS